MSPILVDGKYHLPSDAPERPAAAMAKLTDLKSLLDAAGRTTRAEPASARSRPTASAASPPGNAVPAQSVKQALAAGKHADADIDLARAFADVQKLPPPNRARLDPPRPAPIARNTLADERDVLAEAKYGEQPAPQTWEAGQEFEHEQTFVRKGIGRDIAGKLRRGHWAVQAELDLHGMNTEEAHDALADFVSGARERGMRCVRVIHGKGLTSPNREPVLKGKVRSWLAHWDEVLAYSEAPQHAGGGGAVLVLLRGR
jgi:DNA-nicking Smr family endonuclease